jgi:hypothetical protein
MFKTAYSFDDETVFYFDTIGNKYVAQGGSFAWRINNPGLIKSHSPLARKNGSIGSCNGFAIFSIAEHGHKALSDFLRLKKYYTSTLKAIAEHYQPKDPDEFLLRLTSYIPLPFDKKICSLSKQKFDCLLLAIEKVCGYTHIGNESFILLPRIYAHFENSHPPHDTYAITDNTILSKEEVVKRIVTHRLDGIIVHRDDGTIYIRSRPTYSMWNIHMPAKLLPSIDGEIDTITRAVGEKRRDQCIWGFINGIYNERDDALKSAKLISDAANGEQVLSMPNDMLGWDDDLKVCFVLKIGIDTPVVRLAERFFRHLIALSKENNLIVPIVLFVHSMGAIIAEHALELLNPEERQQLRIFTFGGGSLIPPNNCHPDSHNFISTKDLVCLLGSPYFRTLAMRRYLGFTEGLTQEQLICRWAQEDALLYVDAIDDGTIQKYVNQRKAHIQKQLEEIQNITVMEPGSNYEHSFRNDTYQKALRTVIKKYRKNDSKH